MFFKFSPSPINAGDRWALAHSVENEPRTVPNNMSTVKLLTSPTFVFQLKALEAIGRHHHKERKDGGGGGESSSEELEEDLQVRG